MKITIIGGGNMGGAIARGLTLGTKVAAQEITVSDISNEVLTALKAFNPNINTSNNNATAVEGADMVIIAVKPWLIDRVANEIAPQLIASKPIIISIVAGVPFEHLKEIIHPEATLFRVIPNTAIAIRESMTMIAACNTTSNEEATVCEMFDELGATILIEERLMTAGTALGSCGTAYALRYVRAAMEGGVEMGFYPEQAKKIVAQTVKGAVELLIANGTHPETEIDKVTTPGGITIKGLNEMEHAGFTSAVIRGLKASK